MATSSETRRNVFGLMITPSERERLVNLSRDLGHQNVSAAVRERFPEVFKDEVREGRKPGFSPKKKEC
jgi:hypothetical protein